MLEDLKQRFGRIEEQKATLLARVAARSDTEQMRAPRAGGGWSPRALVHHLVLAEEQTLKHVAAAAAAATETTPGRVLASRRPLVALLAAAMRAGVPLPAPPEMTPPETDGELLILNDAAARWADGRRVFQKRLEAVTVESAREPIARHPIVGPLDARHVLDLAEAHLIYHLRQAARWGTSNERASEKPAG